jgi:hypothetical protein
VKPFAYFFKKIQKTGFFSLTLKRFCEKPRKTREAKTLKNNSRKPLKNAGCC